jgi:ribosomal-protein-serine acetyltransferase
MSTRPASVRQTAIGESCELRPLEESDAEELYAVVERDRDYLSEWLPWPAAQTLEDTREFIRTGRRRAEANGGFVAAIVCGGRIAGVIDMHATDQKERSGRIGYWLAADQQGRGTMTRAVRAVVDHAFASGLNRVEIRVAPGNARSRAIPKRLGFREERTLQDAERLGDGWVDNVVYAMVAADWAGARAD